MGTINVGRVILGGLVAGLIINISESVLNLFVVAAPMEEMLRARNLPPIGGSAIAGFVILSFLLGIVMVWLYAAIRPRFGPGMGTAIKAGLAVFFLAYLYVGVAMLLMGFVPMGLTVTTQLWGLAEVIAGAIVGARLYQE